MKAFVVFMLVAVCALLVGCARQSAVDALEVRQDQDDKNWDAQLGVNQSVDAKLNQQAASIGSSRGGRASSDSEYIQDQYGRRYDVLPPGVDQPGEWMWETVWARDPTTGQWTQKVKKREKLNVEVAGSGSAPGGGQGSSPTQPPYQPGPQSPPATQPAPAGTPQGGGQPSQVVVPPPDVHVTVQPASVPDVNVTVQQPPAQAGGGQTSPPAETEEQRLNRILDEREKRKRIAQLEEDEARRKRKDETREVLQEEGVATRGDLRETAAGINGHTDSAVAGLKQAFDSHVRLSNPTQNYIISPCYEFSPGMCKFPCGVYWHNGRCYPYHRSYYNGCYRYYLRVVPQ